MGLNYLPDNDILRYRNLFDYMSIGLTICNTDGYFIDVNEPYCNITGYSQEEMLNMSFHQITHPEDIAIDIDKVKLLLEGSLENYTHEKRYIRKDNTIIWIKLFASVIPQRKGDPQLLIATIEDITRRKETEAKLIQSKKDWEYIFEAISHPACILDINHKILTVNNAVIKASGKSKEELMGMPCYEIFHDKDTKCPPSACPLNVLLQSGKTETVEMEMDAFDGTFIVSCTPLFDDQGAINKIIHIATDITKLKHIEQALLESEAHYKILVDSAPVGIMVFTDDKIVFTNQTACQILGASSIEELYGKTICSLIISENRTQSKMLLQRMIDGEKGLYPSENKYIRMDGLVIDVQIYAEYITYNGKPGVQMLITDISEAKKAREKLLLTQFGIDHSKIGIFQIDDDGRIKYANEHALVNLGYTEQEILNLLIVDLDPAIDFEEWKRQRSDSHMKGPESFETIHKRKDGSVFPVEITVNYVHFGDTKICFSFVIDISERKRDEASILSKNTEYQMLNEEYQTLNKDLTETLAKQKILYHQLKLAKENAEKSDHLKTAFLQNMSHEIRTPMNAILGFSDLLPEYFEDKAKLTKYTTLIKQRGSDLLEIINDILDIAKIESGQLGIHLDVCNVMALLHEVESFFIDYRERIHKSQIKFQVVKETIDPEISMIIDVVKLKQILTNLITNAFKFTLSGSVTFGCSVIENKTLSFYVKDTGIGIAKNKQNYIFERFTQIDDGLNRSFGGTGLGLPIVKGLVSLLDGHLKLESELEVGSTFYVTFPLKNEKENIHAYKKLMLQ